jgi:hypothetical protein
MTLEHVMHELVKDDFITIAGRCAEIEGDVVFIRSALKVAGQLSWPILVSGNKRSIGASILESDDVGRNRGVRPRDRQDSREYMTKPLQMVKRVCGFALFAVRQQLEMSGLEPYPPVLRTSCRGKE